MHGDAAEWSTDTHLLALLADILQLANWQRGATGQRPKPIPRPGVKAIERAPQGRSKEETAALLRKHYEGTEVSDGG